MQIESTIRRLLVTGPPGCGKTTIVSDFVAELDVRPVGFLTREIRKHGTRIGFSATGFKGRKVIFASKDNACRTRVGTYGVDIDALDELLDFEFSETEFPIVVIDEIGKMELLSSKFKRMIENLWKSDIPVIATIMAARNEFCDRLKKDGLSRVVPMERGRGREVMDELRNFVAKHVV